MATSISTIIEGNVLVSTATFTNASSGALVDPSTIAFVWEMSRQSGTEASLVYSGSSTPLPGTTARLSEGVYVAEVDLTGVNGVLVWQWESSGAGQATAFGQLTVTPLPIG